MTDRGKLTRYSGYRGNKTLGAAQKEGETIALCSQDKTIMANQRIGTAPKSVAGFKWARGAKNPHEEKRE